MGVSKLPLRKLIFFCVASTSLWMTNAFQIQSSNVLLHHHAPSQHHYYHHSPMMMISASKKINNQFIQTRLKITFKDNLPSSSLLSLYSSLSDDYATNVVDGTPRESVTAETLRSLVLTNVNGQKTKLGDVMGKETSIVVFLRHLGCNWCWGNVKLWTELMEQMQQQAGGEEAEENVITTNKSAGNGKVVGPIFVSLGDPEKLELFLEKQPVISPDQIFVEGFDFKAYKDVGLGRYDPTQSSSDLKVKSNLSGWKDWSTFLSSFMVLAPYTKGEPLDFENINANLLRLGGTFVVQGNDIVYRYDERVPGDHPDVYEIYNIAKMQQEQQQKQSSLPSPFNKKNGSKFGFSFPSLGDIFGGSSKSRKQ